MCTLEDVCRAAGWLLRWGGRFCVVFPTERLAELMETARRFGLEPKRLRLVQHDAAGVPGLVLLECRRGGKPGLRAEPALLLYDPDGRETAEHRRAYFREEEQALWRNIISGSHPHRQSGDLSPRGVQTLQEADFIAAEDTRVSMKLLNHFSIRKPLVSYHEHNRVAAGRAYFWPGCWPGRRVRW